MKIVIGMPQPGKDLFRQYMKSKYVQSIRRAGGEVRWIELDDLDRAVKEMLECDGMLLPGGGDVEPSYYGQERTEKCGEPNELRDKGELRLLEAFLPTNKPIFGICRGVQVMNVYFGGTLYQDITTTQVQKHRDFKSRRKGCHKVRMMPRSKLGKLMGSEWALVNSMHHQAVDTLGPGLNVAAVSEDGFIEAVELLLHPFCIGVQWHPEHLSKYNKTQQDLFDAFVAACKEMKN